MKNYIHILLTVLFFISCTQNQGKYPKELQEQLTGLKKATTEDMVRLSPIKWDKHTEPLLYTATGKKLNTQEYQKHIEVAKFIQIFYLDQQDKVRVSVLEPIDPDDTSLVKRKKIKEVALIDKEAPDFEVTDLQGTVYSNKSLRGKVIVINCWFVACPPCRKEIPDLNRLVETFKNQEVVFLGFGKDKAGRIKNFIKKTDFDYHHIAAPRSLLRAYGINRYPTNIIIDKTGKVVFKETGFKKNMYELMEAEIKNLL